MSPINGTESRPEKLQRALTSAAKVADQELQRIYGERVGFVILAGPVTEDDDTPLNYVTNVRQDIARGVLINVGKQIEKGGVQEPFASNDA